MPSYLASDAGMPYCKGCGHVLVLRALGQALETLQLPPRKLAIVTDIGCVGLADSLFLTPHTLHTTHGRSPAFATGLALADSVLGGGGLKPVVLMGDGGAMIGINHLIHAALLNPDVTVLVHNNFLFGMTGGQNSALTPPEFVTSTTPEGNSAPPLDLAQLMLASRASFVARKVTGDRDLSQVIARAISHPGFALVEVLELCTAYGTRWNPLTGARLREVAADVGYELGIITESVRPTFGSTYRERAARSRPNPVEPGVAPGRFSGSLPHPVGLVLAGTAGEHVQTAARVLCQAALWAGLQVTQKYDSPVTQGTGFSVAEVILSPDPILYTGIEAPDGVLVVSEDGARELQASGILARVTAQTLVFADEQTPLPPLPCPVVRLPFRSKAGASDAALAAVAVWLEKTRAFPLESLWAAVDTRFGYDADMVAGKLQQMLEIAYPRK